MSSYRFSEFWWPQLTSLNSSWSVGLKRHSVEDCAVRKVRAVYSPWKASLDLQSLSVLCGDLRLRRGYSRFTHPAGGSTLQRLDLNLVESNMKLAENDLFVKFDKGFANVSCFWNWPPKFSDMMLSSPLNTFWMTSIWNKRNELHGFTVSPSFSRCAEAIGQAKAHSFMADQETKYEATEASVRQGEAPSLLNMSKERRPMNIGSATQERVPEFPNVWCFWANLLVWNGDIKCGRVWLPGIW